MKRPQHSRPSPTRRALLAATAAAVVAIAGCGDNGTAPEASSAFSSADFGHVHGAGVNPRDGALFIASHNGVFRLAPGADVPERVADRYQDTMGFAIAGPDHFYGSGHPDGRDDLPPYLGLIESRDGARSWRPVSLLGDVDFHALAVAEDRVWGYGSDFESRESRFMASRNGGKSWRRLVEPEPLMAIALHPRKANVAVVSGTDAAHKSVDGGRSWQRLDAQGGLLAWPADDALYAVDAKGDVSLSADGGESWTRRGSTGGPQAAIYAVDGQTVVAVTHDGRITRTTDGGNSWSAWSP